MKHLRTIFAVGVLATGLAGCSDSSAGLFTPEGPRMNGYTYGSGHQAGTDSTSAVVSEETTADDGTEERGGYTYGSGH